MDAVSPFHHGHKVRPMFPSLHPTLESVHSGQKHDLHSGLFIKDVDMVSGRERVDRRGGGGGGGERGISEARGGRSRSPLVPLRNRQLPASFWQEPNVPRGYMYPLLPYPVHLHPMAAVWSEYNNPGATLTTLLPQTGSSSGNNSSKTSGHVQSSKEFLDRLQSAQARGYDLAASRFPITEFLFYNYGLKSYLEPFDAAAATTGHFHRGCPMPGSAAGGGSSGGGVVSKAVPVSGVSGVEGASSGLTFPTLCPYLGYNCPNLHNGHTPHRFWDCVTGQSCTSSSSSAFSSSGQSPVGVGGSVGGGGAVRPGGQAVWKPVSGRTVSAYAARYHPFC